MPSGGHARSGPAPDPNALRRGRKDDAGWTVLPAEGRTTPAPVWPLTEAAPRELELWADWWKQPVALLWDDLYYVAFTVRLFVEAEQPKARAEDRKSLRAMLADLYMTPDSKLRRRLKIVGDEVAAKRVEPAPVRSSARDRLTVVADVDGG